MIHAVVGALVLAAISTAGDFVWANWRVRHLAVYGVIHGVVMFAAAGYMLGARHGRGTISAIGGVIAGAAGAASFYALRPLAGYGAMFASWILVWVVLGTIVKAGGSSKAGVTRGVAAALLSGVAFYLVSGMWMPFNPSGPLDYAEHFVRWTIAFLPGFAALLLGSSPAVRTSP
jgi:hypothetical protein